MSLGKMDGRDTRDRTKHLKYITDMTREPKERAKHLKLIVSALSTPLEKRQFVDEFGFEIISIVDGLLLHSDHVDMQMLSCMESALWALEQLLLHAPELIGRGWQRRGIEYFLRRALHPNNVTSIRKYAIRLFLILYQCLSVYNNTTSLHDSIFRCCLPHFPLQNGEQTETVLTAICENQLSISRPSTSGEMFDTAFDPRASKAFPLVPNSAKIENLGLSDLSQHPPNAQINLQKERAQTLQLYIDKFLEYSLREITCIEWGDPHNRLECAKFLLDRIITLYIYEVFPNFETTGIDIFGGWEATELEETQIMDVTNPLVVARYWLIRWVNIASERSSAASKTTISATSLFKQALFSSQKAINVLLSVMQESMRLPIACVNVIQKALALVRCWLFQNEVPSFVDLTAIQWEAWNSLLVSIPGLFLKNSHIFAGDRTSSAISLTRTVLQLFRDLANPSTLLPRTFPHSVWEKLVRILTTTIIYTNLRRDEYVIAVSGDLSSTLLTVCIFIQLMREIPLKDELWDEVWAVFRTALSTQMVDQWSIVADCMTKGLVLNIFGINLNRCQKTPTPSQIRCRCD